MWDRSVGHPSISSRCTVEAFFARPHPAPCHRPHRALDVQRRRQHVRRNDKRHRLVRGAASESDTAVPQPLGPGTVKELPIFPLGMVAFPTAEVPLNIFEARYRVLMSTLLAGSDGIDQDLVNDQKPWCGSRLFGMCFASKEGMAVVGTTLYIQSVENLPDGRLLINTKGVEKFKVLNILEERPVLVCQVEMLEDSDDMGPGARGAADETVQLFKDLIELNVRMNRIPSARASVDPKLDSMTPREVSYWLALIFSQNPPLQQALLEETSLLKRISQEKEILEGTTKFLRAKVALQSAFSDGEKAEDGSQEGAPEGKGDSEQPPPAAGNPG